MKHLNAKCRNTEVNDAAYRIVKAYQEITVAEDTYLADTMTEMETQTSVLTEAIKRMKAESMLEEKDEQRDNDIRALYYLVSGSTYNPTSSIKDSAAEVLKVLDNYGLNMANESYSSESSLLNSMFEDLTKLGLMPATIPGCMERIETLKLSQQEFEESRLAYEKEKAISGELQSATKLKNDVLGMINNNLVVYLKAMLLVDETKYKDFALTVSTIINETNEIVKRRSSKVAEVES